MKQKRLAISLALLASVGVSCDSPTRLPTTGSISIVLLTPGTGQLILANTARALAGSSGELTPAPDAPANLTLQGARVTVTGPTNKTISSTTPNGANFDLVVTDLTPGNYTVVVEGLVASQTVYFGQTANVSVTAGGNTTSSVTFASFQPALTAPTVVDTSDVLHFLVNFGAVSNATSYIVAVSPNSDMSGATTKTATTTSVDVAVTSEGKYFVTVKAVNSAVPTGGAPSTPKGVYAFQGVATVTVTPANPSIGIGGTQALVADAKDSDGNAVASVQWFWVSENQSVARVSQAGVVTGVSGGTATITAVGKGTPGSTTVTVGAQTAAKLSFSIQPTDGVAGDPFSPAVQVEVQDASGNRITSSRDPITIAIANNPNSGTLSGTKTVNAINGIASFSGLWIDKSGLSYTLNATSGSLTLATSGQFNIIPGVKAKLAFVAQPSNAAANTAISPSVTVRFVDQFDNAIFTGTDPVTISLAGSPWKNAFSTGGAVGGAVTVAAVGGLATFNNLRLDKPGVGFTLSASSGGLTAGTSNAFNVSLNIASIVGGDSHTCAIGALNTGTFCWGNNQSGQLGIVTGFGGTDSIPSLVRGGLVFTSVVAGQNHTCGLTAGNAAYCWGNNSQGQLGNNTFSSSDVPVLVTGNHAFSSISTAGNHTCGITTSSGIATENQQVYCWGYNVYGQLGNNAFGADTANKPFPIRVNEPLQTTALAVQISTGFYDTCVVAVAAVGGARNAYCWGYGGNGQMGDATNVDKHVPTLVSGGLQWASVAVGTYYHVCGIVFSDNSARCWGYNGWGNLGDGTTTQSNVPVAMSNVAGFAWSSLSLGNYHSCGLRSNGEVYCWGNNGSGQLGEGTTTDANARKLVSGGLTFTSMKAGGQHTCGRVNAASIYCWGANYDGQLGNAGNGQQKSVPTQIAQ